MCDFSTKNPDEHAKMCIETMIAGVLGLLRIMNSHARNAKVTNHFLQELKGHHLLKRSLPKKAEVKKQLMEAIAAELEKIKKEVDSVEIQEVKQRKKIGTQPKIARIEWQPSKGLIEILANQLVLDFLSE